MTFPFTVASIYLGVGEFLQWHGRAGRSIKHPAGHLQQLKPAIMFERGLYAHNSLPHTGPVGSHLQAKPLNDAEAQSDYSVN